MGLLDKLWDDVVAGPQPDKGLGLLRRKNAKNLIVDPTALDGDQAAAATAARNMTRSSSAVTQSIFIKPPPLIRSSSSLSDDSAVSSPGSPSSVSPGSSSRSDRENVWRHFHPGSGGRLRAMEKQGSARFDTVTPNSTSPSVYDWMYSPDSRNKWH